ncbi:thioredoxin family protein [Moorella sp. ACPs]|uniref:thioredoxin family protein n=1 Tax=Neomoorella carbonis TaxID=3062783 RepID=UPI003249313D
MEIKVLGTGCARCKALEQNVMNALAEMGVAADVEKVTDLNKITDYGVMIPHSAPLDIITNVYLEH